MSNRRNFIRQVATAGFVCQMPLVLSATPSAADEKLSPDWLELVSPGSLGMDTDILEEVDILIKESIAIGHTPGAVVAIGRGNKMCFLKGYGHRQFYPEKEEITLDTIFDLASTTKVASTATAVALVVDQGKISPDDFVVDYFPEFGSNGKDKITLRHLFTHTSGLGFYDHFTKGTKDELFKLVCSLKLNFPVGEKYEYNDNNALMSGHIVEKVSGQNLRDFTIENIYKPLGMADTMYNPDIQRIQRTAATEMRDGKWYKGVVNDFATYNLGGIGGDTGLFSTAPDLAILSALWLGKGTFVRKDGSTVKLFSPETFDTMIASQFMNVGIRGLLWDKRSGGENRPWNMSPDAIGHGGWTGTSIWVDPKMDLFVVVLGNRRHPFGQSPNIYPAAGKIGVVAVNSILRKNETLSLYYNQTIRFSNRPRINPVALESLKGSKTGLIISQEEMADPNGLFARIKNLGIEIAALYLPDELSSDPAVSQDPAPVKTEIQTGAPVYSLTRDNPRILPQMLHGAGMILFGLKAYGNSTDDSFWFTTHVLGHTLQGAADYRLKYAIVDYPNPAPKRFTVLENLTDKLKPFGEYSRQAQQFGLTFCDVASKINEEQLLELNIEFVRAD